ncbi:MAG: hypothetical protein HLUCCO03_17380 [Marinobacter sp. HL-58]|nr:MAG: hypothetical protein HLUCCO03_17380 [Marinobacter sp. HL-58]
MTKISFEPSKKPRKKISVDFYYVVEVLTKLPSSTMVEDLDQLLPWNQRKPFRCSSWTAYVAFRLPEAGKNSF